jgi:hypothetical protein
MTETVPIDTALLDAKAPLLTVLDRVKAEHAASKSAEPDPAPTTNGAPDPIEPEEDAVAKPERHPWKVVVNGSTLQTQTEISLDAIAEANDPPFLFNRARSLVRVVFDENGNPFISVLNEAGVRGILERSAEYVKTRVDGSETPTFPPIEVVKDIMNLPEWYTIPPITGIVEVPIVLTDGGLVLKQGYDRKTRLFYAPAPDLVIPAIPDRPGKADVDRAVALIEEIFVDFPFVDGPSKANMIGALLTAVLRPMILGPVPMAIIDKPQAGTGATLLSEVIATVATGRSAALMTAPEDDAAWRKAITASLSQGRNLAIVDNVETKLYTASLAAVLTSNTWTDRRFGKNDEMITLPHTMFWISTGNNLQLGGDLPRRCFWIRLDAQSARPWQRTDYRHPDLMPWIARERGRILGAILTIVRGWILAGRPKPSAAAPRMGGFDGWRDTIGGILECCGVPGFLLNTEEMYAQADLDGPQWEAFLEKWFTIWGVRPVTVAEIQSQMQREGDSLNVAYGSDRLVDYLPDALADALSGKKNFARVLGHSLSKMNGRKFLNGLTLRKGKDSHSKVAAWTVLKTEQQKLENCGVLKNAIL